MDGARTYRFSITVTVEPGQEGYDDPEWIADAAWGSLANEYGYECTFGDITELPGGGSALAPSDVAEP
ncbi:MAG: hypothetical protein ACRD29_16870 [Acidimicrobiales bacterium]